MSRRCTICRHPQHEAITVSVLRNGLRPTARTFQVSLPALYRHKGHLPRTLVKAEQDQEVTSSNSLLAQVRDLMSDCRAIAAKADAAQQWSQATGALPEVSGCLELLAKLESELRSTSERSRPAQATGELEKLTRAELQLLSVGSMYERTNRFDPAMIAQLKILAEKALELERNGLDQGSRSKGPASTPWSTPQAR